MARQAPDPWAVLLPRGDPSAAGLTVDAGFQADTDALCPRCLGWIEAHHYVRRTLIGLLEHEACPSRPRDLLPPGG